MTYEWPGNIRQLEHAIHSSSVLAAGPEITKDELASQIVTLNTQEWKTAQATLNQPNPQHPFGLDEKNVYRNFDRINLEVQKRMIEIAWNWSKCSETRAADFLGMPRGTFQYKRKSLFKESKQ